MDVGRFRLVFLLSSVCAWRTVILQLVGFYCTPKGPRLLGVGSQPGRNIANVPNRPEKARIVLDRPYAYRDPRELESRDSKELNPKSAL